MTRRGKRIACLSACVSVSALAGAAILSREALLEWWRFRRLYSEDLRERTACIDGFDQRELGRSVPHLIRVIGKSRDEWIYWGMGSNSKVAYCTPAIHAIYHAGLDAIPEIDRAIEACTPDSARADRLKAILLATKIAIDSPEKLALERQEYDLIER